MRIANYVVDLSKIFILIILKDGQYRYLVIIFLKAEFDLSTKSLFLVNDI